MSSLARIFGRPLIALTVIGAVAGVLRFHNLGSPPERIFDEFYYAKSACLYVGHTPDECAIEDSGERYWLQDQKETGSWVHPPLGKWAIAAGIAVAGNDPVGWRVSSAVAGTATVVVIALIALLLTGSVVWTYVAGLLLATENLNFVQSRVALLDIFLAFWVVLGFLFLLLDRRWIERKQGGAPSPEPGPAAAALSPGLGAMALEEPLPATAAPRTFRVPAPILRPWRMAAGVAFGAACATKWSGVQALFAAGLLVLFWETTRRRRAGLSFGRALWQTIQMESLGVILAFVLVPIAVYLASYIRYFVEVSHHPTAFWHLQKDMFHFHSTLHYTHLNESTGLLENTHPYESKPWTWLPMLRPVSYYFKGPGREVLGMGNPLIFWGSILAIPYAGRAWYKRRDWRAGFLVVAILVQYLPWFLFASRVQFFFYMTPISPFLVLVVMYALKDMTEYRPVGAESRPLFPVAAGFIGASVAAFAYFYPVLVAWDLSYTAWHLRMWMPSWV